MTSALRIAPPGRSLAENGSPALLAQWHPTKNEGLTPAHVTVKSGRKVWWQCEQGHEWEARIANRSNGSGCPVCAGAGVFPGVNDLSTTHPEIAAQWHPTKNTRALTSVAADSNGKAWWMCAEGHEWEALIGSRTRARTRCPYCSGLKAIPGQTDLASTHPQVAQQWHAHKNASLTAESITARSTKQVWWQCEQGHEWEAAVNDMARRSRGCPVCAGRVLLVGFNDLATTHPDLATQWHPIKNGDLTPKRVTRKSDQSVWWVCEYEHEWMARPWDRTRTGAPIGCPFCAGRAALPGFNDLATLRPDLADEWVESQALSPLEVTLGSNYQAEWKCPLGHVYVASVNNRVAGSKCHYCSGRLALEGFNDLATLYPRLVEQWDSEKNSPLRPSDLRPGSEKKVWWQCESEHSWEATVNSRTNGSGCPRCAPVGHSKGEKEIVNWLQQQGISVLQKVKKYTAPYELDIYLPEHKFAIEYNEVYGHSEAAGKGKDYHANKVRLAQEAGITLFQVWEDDWRDREEIVKRMILHRLGLSNEPTVFARQTRVVELDATQAYAFLDVNHIQGRASGSLYLGLRDRKGFVVAVMVLKRMPGGIVYLERYATSCRVPGGFTRLLKYAIASMNPTKIITFADRSVSEGNLYEKNGFVVDGVLRPDYMYLVRGSRVHKFNYRLKRFRDDPNLEYIEGLSESQLAQLNGLHRIWDSGKTRYVLVP